MSDENAALADLNIRWKVPPIKIVQKLRRQISKQAVLFFVEIANVSIKTSQELGMFSMSLSDFQTITLNVMI